MQGSIWKYILKCSLQQRWRLSENKVTGELTNRNQKFFKCKANDDSSLEAYLQISKTNRSLYVDALFVKKYLIQSRNPLPLTTLKVAKMTAHQRQIFKA
jgi:hypothetical protein